SSPSGYGRSFTVSVQDRRPETGSNERRLVLLDERLERHGRPAAELLDQVVRPRKDPVLVIDRALPEMLEEEGVVAAAILPPRLLPAAELLEVDLLVLDVLAEDPAQELGGLLVGVFDRAEQRINLARVRRGIFEEAGDHAALVLSRDRRVLAGTERHMEPAGPDHRGEIEQPLREGGRPDVE